MNAQEARKLLERFDEETTTVAEANRTAYLQSQLLLEVMRGDRSTELAQLHYDAARAKQTSNEDLWRTLVEKRDAILDELYDRIVGKLDTDLENGEPAPWQNWPK